MIYLLCSTIKPEVFKTTYKEWIDKADNPDIVTTKIVVDHQKDAESLKDFDVIVYDDAKNLGITKPLTKLTTSLDGLDDSDIIIVMSDDFFPPKHWDTYLLKCYKNFTGALSVNDGTSRPDQLGIIAIPIMDYATLKKLNKIVYHPVYTHLWSDNELSDNLKELGLLKVAPNFKNYIFEHRHWVVKKRKLDNFDLLLHKSESHDKIIYNTRKSLKLSEKLAYGKNTKTLSILICSLKSRKLLLARLYNKLKPQLAKYDNVEVLVHVDDGTLPIGEKRNKLLNSASGKYICYIDDDDLVTDDYVSLLLRAAKQNPDCIGIEGEMTTNGKNPKKFTHSIKYTKWETLNGVYVRTPNHLNPVKTNLALSIRFKSEMNFGEDADYSKRLRPILKSEAYICKQVYKYLFTK